MFLVGGFDTKWRPCPGLSLLSLYTALPGTIRLRHRSRVALFGGAVGHVTV